VSENADRNLLFGVLAVQLDYIRAPQMMTAANQWMLDKSRPLGEILVEMQALSREDCQFVDVIVDKHIARTGSPANSLSSLQESSGSALERSQLSDWVTQLHQPAAATLNDPGNLTVDWQTSGGPSLVGPRFEVLRDLARGGLGEVSVARDRELEREVALKRLLDGAGSSADARQRFVAEAKITGGLEHPGIVPVYGLGVQADGKPFYAMRLIRGSSLHASITQFHKERQGRPSSFGEDRDFRVLLRSLVDACNAVGYAHSRGVLHRDLKPQNIMLGKFGETLVVDWGLAKVVESSVDTLLRSELPMVEGRSGDSQPTLMGSVLGTPAYMSPEQAEGRIDQLDATSDVFSLGASLYAVLVGRAPYAAPTRVDVLEAARRGDFARPRAVNALIPKPLEAICLKAMAKSPAERYASPTQLAEDLESWIAGAPVVAYPESVAQRSLRWARKHQTLVASSLVLLVVSSLGLLLANHAIGVQRDIARQERDHASHMEARAVSFSNVSGEIIDEFVKSLADEKWSQFPKIESERIRMVDLAVDRILKLLDDSPEDKRLKDYAMQLLVRAGNLYQICGQEEKAKERLDRAIQLVDEQAALTASDPEQLAALNDILAYSNELLAVTSGAWAALPSSEKGVALCRMRVQRDPSPLSKLGLAVALQNYAKICDATSRWEDAVDAAVESEALLRGTQLPATHQLFDTLLRCLALTVATDALRGQQKFDEADAMAQRALDIAAAGLKKYPDEVNSQNVLQFSSIARAHVWIDQGDMPQAKPLILDAMEFFQQRIADFPDVTDNKLQMATVRTLLGEILVDESDLAGAQQQAEAALDLFAALEGQHGLLVGYWSSKLAAQLVLLAALEPAGEAERITLLKQEIAELCRQLERRNPHDPILRVVRKTLQMPLP
jgi:eukaryotic-like serine/threonine-protein kinase